MHKHMQHRGASGACRGGVQWRLLAMTSYLPKRSTSVTYCVDPATAARWVRSESKASTWGLVGSHSARSRTGGLASAEASGGAMANLAGKCMATKAGPTVVASAPLLFRLLLRLASCLAIPSRPLPD